MRKCFIKFKCSSDKILNQLMSKLKMVKQDTLSNSFVDEGNSASGSNKSTKQSENSHTVMISSENIPVLCEQLEKFIDEIKLSTNYEYLVYDCPFVLEKRLEDSVRELEFMLSEIKNAHDNIQKQKLQQKYVDQEKSSLNKILKKLKDNEIREMETIVSLFDNGMYIRWQTIKSTRKSDVLERFLSDIKSKQLALENLNTLVSRKLTSLTMFATSTVSGVKKKMFSKAIPLPFPSVESSDISIIPTPLSPSPPAPPLPPRINSIMPVIPQITTRSPRQRTPIEQRRR